ncbi:MAG: Uma2 family endonuclease [Bryobacteraceae bacterium]
MAAITKAITYDEWLKLPVVEDAIEEVVDGEVHIMPPNKSIHARVVHKLTVVFSRQLPEREVEILGSSFGLVIRQEPLTTRAPDLALFLKATMTERDGYFHSPPDLLVEVLSDANSRSERAAKLRDYESLGVPEVWVVSPEAQTVEILLLTSGKLVRDRIVADGELHPQRFPGAKVDIESIWPAY